MSKDFTYNPITKELQFEDQSLPTSGEGWEESREYREGVDFAMQWQWFDVALRSWVSDNSINSDNNSNWNTRQAAVLIPKEELTNHKSILSIVKDRVAQKHGYADYLQIDMIDASIEEKEEIKDSMTNEIAYEYAHYKEGKENLTEEKEEKICSVNCGCKTGEECYGEAGLNLVKLHDSPRSFQEDYTHENGQYVNICCNCKNYFMGYKRCIVCKKCELPTELSKEGEGEEKEDEKWLFLQVFHLIEGNNNGTARGFTEMFTEFKSQGFSLTKNNPTQID